MNKINKKIVEKFNELFYEISAYYNKESDIKRGALGLYTIYSTGLDYSVGTAIHEHSADSIKVSEFLIWLNLNYKHLVPFYELHFSQVKNSGIDFQDDMFNKINKVITEIRKEKIFIDDRKKGYNGHNRESEKSFNRIDWKQVCIFNGDNFRGKLARFGR